MQPYTYINLSTSYISSSYPFFFILLFPSFLSSFLSLLPSLSLQPYTHVNFSTSYPSSSYPSFYYSFPPFYHHSPPLFSACSATLHSRQPFSLLFPSLFFLFPCERVRRLRTARGKIRRVLCVPIQTTRRPRSVCWGRVGQGVILHLYYVQSQSKKMFLPFAVQSRLVRR